ncbi:Protein CBG15620 [Caenorhabditis briggsae]|uniref:Protein CBG15620 n=1 Tax=Caenorhabditis briggsae TaxID=6238 RepID=A8XME4_CAEBR|nr:Protein CBG15620 [Caenorhabditis briggsae]CAP33819.2 Protein CBG15620 [Caenorhabditis briggsae]
MYCESSLNRQEQELFKELLMEQSQQLVVLFSVGGVVQGVAGMVPELPIGGAQQPAE